MNVVDIAILVVLALFLLKGLLRGLLKELCSLLGLFGGLAIALLFHPYLAEGLLETFPLPPQLGVVVAFAALFLLTVLLFALIGAILSRFIKLLFLGGFNRVAGGLFGIVQGGAVLILVLFGLSRSPLPEQAQSYLRQSRLTPPLVDMGATLLRHGKQLGGSVERAASARLSGPELGSS